MSLKKLKRSSVAEGLAKGSNSSPMLIPGETRSTRGQRGRKGGILEEIERTEDVDVVVVVDEQND